ncbi:MAG: hypothetical protein ACK5XL_00230, partial [Cyclobacteriaceae bacterium]
MKPLSRYLALLLIFAGCESESIIPVSLQGRFMYADLSNRRVMTFENGVDYKSYRIDSDLQLDQLSWLNSEDTVIARTYGVSLKNMYNESIECFLLNDSSLTRINKALYSANRGNSIWSFSASVGGTLLALTEVGSDSCSIKVVSVKTGRQDLAISYGSGYRLDISEWPWSHDASKFTYAVTATFPVEDRTALGIFVYDILLGKPNRIASEGFMSVWSNDSKYIAYATFDKVFIVNVLKQETELIYESGWFERISKIHWSPDGEYIRIHGWRKLPLLGY